MTKQKQRMAEKAERGKNKQHRAGGKKGRGRVLNVILILILLIGLMVLLYPTVSNLINTRSQSRAVSSYREAVENLSEEDYTAVFAAAQAYNEELSRVGSAMTLTNPDKVAGYEQILDITGDGIMGYVTISRLGVQLPIYHGTSSKVLSAGAGHLKGSSLPIGGSSTHAVISAHRGMPQSRLFTDLDQLKEGDIFSVTVLDQTVYYQVDRVEVILPDELEYLYIEPGEDYCTLMTCTPYGINTHRLLVRGVPTDPKEGDTLLVGPDAYQVSTLIVVLAVVLLLALLALVVYGIIRLTKKRRRKARGKDEPAKEPPVEPPEE